MAKRIYDKGERRHKHVGSKDEPEFQHDDSNPKKIIGKCPKNVPDDERDRLLQEAIYLDDVESDLAVPKRIYAVYKGAIYEAQTSDFGKTYHAYPFRGKLSAKIIERLKSMADEEKCRDEFDGWVKRYIERHGR